MLQQVINITKFIKKNRTKCNNVSKFYYSIFIWSSTCFGRHAAHHQEPKTVLAASGISCFEGCWTCSWWTLSGTAWQRPPTTRPTTFHVWKTRGCQCSFRLLVMGVVSPETCWASYKYGIIKILIHFCILLDFSLRITFGLSLLFCPSFLFFFLLFLELKDWFLKARADVQKFGKLFFFFYLLLPLPTSVCSALYSLLCFLFYKLVFCLHISTDISATSSVLLHSQSALRLYFFPFLLSS